MSYKGEFIFAGELSDESKQYLIKQQMIRTTLYGIVFSILISIPIIVIAICYNILILLFLALPFIFILISIVSPLYSKDFPKEIEVIDDVIYVTTKYGIRSRSIKDIKEVIDTCDSYFIIFYFPKITTCLCQKDLLIKGSLEDFEQLFDGKIKMRIQNKEGK